MTTVAPSLPSSERYGQPRRQVAQSDKDRQCESVAFAWALLTGSAAVRRPATADPAPVRCVHPIRRSPTSSDG